MFGKFFKKRNERFVTVGSTKTMSDVDMDIIFRFANGDDGLRAQAIKAHRDNFGVSNIHNRFMAEIDTPSPDLALRAILRQDVINNGAPDVKN